MGGFGVEEVLGLSCELRQEELQAAGWLEEEVQSSFQVEAEGVFVSTIYMALGGLGTPYM